MGLIAQRNHLPKAGSTDIAKVRVQGAGPDGKTVYTTTLVERGGQGKVRYFANGKQLPAYVTTAEAARIFVRQQIAKGTLGQLALGDQSAFTQSTAASADTPVAPVRIELGDPHPARLTEWLSGGAVKTALPENHGAREVARSAGVAFSKDGRSLNLPNNELGGQLFAQMQHTRWQRNSPYPMEWGPLIPKPVGMSADFVAGFKAEWARMNKQGWMALGAEALMTLGGALGGARAAGRTGPLAGSGSIVAQAPGQRLTPTAAVDKVRASLSKFERAPSGAGAAELNAALNEANSLVKGHANRATLPDGLIKQYASLHMQAQRSLGNALRGLDTGKPAAAPSDRAVTANDSSPGANGSAVQTPRGQTVAPLSTMPAQQAVPRVAPLPAVGPASNANIAPAKAATGSSALPELKRVERRPGESMSDYLTRQNMPQSLTPQQQRSADKYRMRMSATPPKPGLSSRRPPDAVSTAIKMRAFGNSAGAIANPRLFDNFLNQLDKKPMSIVMRIGNTVASALPVDSLADRTRTYRQAGIHNLSRQPIENLSPQLAATRSPVMQGGKAHEGHTVFGAVSKLGEVHTGGGAFNLSQASWASRGLLPGQGGKPVSEFWKPNLPFEWGEANEALAHLSDAGSQISRERFETATAKPLRDAGFASKGSALSARLERLEKAISAREKLQQMLGTAKPAEASVLQGWLRKAEADVQRRIDDFANRATQVRGELLMESLGTPKTTYELTIRHAAAARYFKSIEGQADPVFSASKFKALMTEVKKEAGPEAKVSQAWHRALIERYSTDTEFQSAMQQGTAMQRAWAAYEAQYRH